MTSHEPTNVVFTPGAAAVHGETVPFVRPEPEVAAVVEPVEIGWTQTATEEQATLAGAGEFARLPVGRSFGSVRNPKAFIGQELVGTFEAGDDIFAVVGIDDATTTEHPVRDYVVTRVSTDEKGSAEIVGRIPREGHAKPLLIGRHPDSDSAHLAGQSTLMSNRHAQVVIREGAVIVQDLGSKNNTRATRPRVGARAHDYLSRPWALSQHIAEAYRPAIVEAVPQGERRIVATPAVENLRAPKGTRQETTFSEQLRGRQPLATRGMMLERYALPASLIAAVELTPGRVPGRAARTLYLLDRQTQYFEPPRQFVPGARPLEYKDRYALVTEEFLEAAELARETGDFSALRDERGIHIFSGGSGSVELGSDIWGLVYTGGERSPVSRRHARVNVDGGGSDLPNLRVTDLGSSYGTRVTYPEAGPGHEVTREPDIDGMTVRIGSTAISDELSQSRPY